MIYKIVVDKQPMTNPSEEKKEYEIDIEELRFKRDVYDSLVITPNEDYVMRRLELGEYNVLTELNPSIKEPLPDLNIELFEGDNYIYLYDMTGNRIVAQYLVKNEFNELYVTQSEMDSAITQSAGKIELKVSQKLEGYATKSEMNSAITQKADEIQQQVNDIETLTEVVKGTTSIELDNCANGNLVELHIYGNNSVFKQKYISDSLLIGDTQYVLGDSRLIITNTPSNSTTSTTQTIELGITEVLRQNGKTYDEYILKDNKAQIIRRINADGTIKSTPTTQDLGSFSIVLKEGKNTIKIQNYTADMEAKFVYKNSYTTAFATSVEMNTKIKQTAKEINLGVNQTLTNYSTTNEMNSAIALKANEITSTVSKKVGNDEIISKINQSSEAVTIDANKIKLNGKTINLTGDNIKITSTNFNVDKNGNMICKNANVTGTISSNNATVTGGKISLVPTGGTDVLRVIKNNNTNTMAYMTENVIAINDNARHIECYCMSGSASIDVFREGGTGTYISDSGITTPKVTQTSKAEEKKNFEKMQDNALEIIKNIDIYKYNLKGEEDDTKKHIGFVIGDDFNYSQDVTSVKNDGVDVYSFVSVCCKAIQEQQEEIEELKKEIEKLKGGE